MRTRPHSIPSPGNNVTEQWTLNATALCEEDVSNTFPMDNKQLCPFGPRLLTWYNIIEAETMKLAARFSA